MTEDTALAEKMKALAALHPDRAEELIAKAEAFTAAANDYYAGKAESPKAMMGAWARARRLYCDITGEPLI